MFIFPRLQGDDQFILDIFSHRSFLAGFKKDEEELISTAWTCNNATAKISVIVSITDFILVTFDFTEAVTTDTGIDTTVRSSLSNDFHG